MLLSVYSCVSNNSNSIETKIIGVWQLEREFSNEEEDGPLKEFLLSSCEKLTTLEVLMNGRFIEKSYYEDFGTGGECVKDTWGIQGDWEKGSEGTFNFKYDKNNILFFDNSTVAIENGKLIISIVYYDSDLRYKTMLKFIYTKKLNY